MSKIIIKSMGLEHLEMVMDIESCAYGEHHWSRESFVNEINNDLAYYICAFDEDGRLLGYLGSWIVLDEAHITTIAVAKKHKRRGIATILVNRFIEFCYFKEVKYITLEVRVSNAPAINLYKKYGFNSLGTRKGYYQDNNEDALIMWTENIWDEKFKSLYNFSKDMLRDVEVVDG